jgi:hypothetical protein
MNFEQIYMESCYQYSHLIYSRDINSATGVYVGMNLRQPIIDQVHRQVFRPTELVVMIATVRQIQELLNSAKVSAQTSR